MACPTTCSTRATAWGWLVMPPGPHQVPGHHAHDPVAQLVLVHQDAQAGRQGVVDVLVAVGQHRPGVPVRSSG